MGFYEWYAFGFFTKDEKDFAVFDDMIRNVECNGELGFFVFMKTSYRGEGNPPKTKEKLNEKGKWYRVDWSTYSDVGTITEI